MPAVVAGVPKMLRPGAVALAVVLAAACGGTSFEKTSPSTAATTTTTVESAETKAWVAAAIQGLMVDPSEPLSRVDATCLSRALVHTVTVARFKAAGTTTEDLSDPNRELPTRTQSIRTAGGAGGSRQGDAGLRVRASDRHRLHEQHRRECQRQLPGIRQGERLRRGVVRSAGPAPTRRRHRLESRSVGSRQPECRSTRRRMSRLRRDDGPRIRIRDFRMRSGTASTRRRGATSSFSPRWPTGSRESVANSTEGFAIFGARIVKCLTPEHIVALGDAKNVPRPGCTARVTPFKISSCAAFTDLGAVRKVHDTTTSSRRDARRTVRSAWRWSSRGTTCPLGR